MSQDDCNNEVVTATKQSAMNLQEARGERCDHVEWKPQQATGNSQVNRHHQQQQQQQESKRQPQHEINSSFYA